MKQYLKLVKYLRGTAKVLDRLGDEIAAQKAFNKDDEELLSKIGANLLYHAKTYAYLSKPEAGITSK